MKRTCERPECSSTVLLARWRVILIPFAASLIEQQYWASVIYIKALHGLALDRWLAKRRVALADLREAQIERYQDRCRHRHRRIRTATRQIERKAVTQLLQFLRARGVCPPAPVETTAAKDLAAHFEQHLQDQQGSQPQRSSATATSRTSFCNIALGAAQ
jgi:hypothetical protein